MSALIYPLLLLLLQAPSRTLSEQLIEMTRRVEQLIPYIQFEVVSPIAPYFELIAWVMGGLIAMLSLLKVMAEETGAGLGLFKQVARIILVVAMFGTGYSVMDGMRATGGEMAGGGENGDNPLVRLYKEQRDAFDAGYAKFIENQFMVKVNGSEQAVTPPDNGSEAILSVPYDREGTIRDFDKKMSGTFSMSNLLWALNGIRSGLEFGDFFLAAVAGVTFLALRILLPFMIMMAIDKGLAHRTSYPYLWGVIVLTLVWPVVATFLRMLAYMSGNIGLALGDPNPVYNWDYATMNAVKNPLSQPVVTIAFAAFFMFVSMVMLWVSPVIAMWITLGKAYEAVSGVVSNATGILTGAAIELFSAQAAAGFQRSADVGMANASADAETTRAEANWQSSNMRAQVTNTKEHAGIEAGRVAAVGSAQGALTTQLILIGAQASQSHAMLKSDTERSQEMARIDRQQGVATTATRAESELHQSAAESHAAKTELWDRTWNRVTGGAVPFLPAATSELGWAANTDRTRGRNTAIEHLSSGTIEATNLAGNNRIRTQGVYQTEVDRTIDTYAGAAAGGARAGFAQAVGAYNRAAGISGGGVDRGYRMELGANRTAYDGQIRGAGIMRAAGIEAATNRAIASVISNVGRELSRSIDRAIQFRF